jgi:hypothetical protein
VNLGNRLKTQSLSQIPGSRSHRIMRISDLWRLKPEEVSELGTGRGRPSRPAASGPVLPNSDKLKAGITTCSSPSHFSFA